MTASARTGRVMRFSEEHITPVVFEYDERSEYISGKFEVVFHGNGTATVRGTRVGVGPTWAEITGRCEYAYETGLGWKLDPSYSKPGSLWREERGREVTDSQRGHWVAACRRAIEKAVYGDEGKLRLAAARAHYAALMLRSAEIHVEQASKAYRETIDANEAAGFEYANAVLALDELTDKVRGQEASK